MKTIKLGVVGEFHQAGKLNFSVKQDEDGCISLSESMARKVRNHLCPRWTKTHKNNYCSCTSTLPFIVVNEGGSSVTDEAAEAIKELVLEQTAN